MSDYQCFCVVLSAWPRLTPQIMINPGLMVYVRSFTHVLKLGLGTKVSKITGVVKNIKICYFCTKQLYGK